MAHALLNSIISNDQLDVGLDITERYAYRRGSQYINEYARTREDGMQYAGDPGNPNHLLGSFPTLFPYGMGGFEITRPVKVSYERHIRWALRYHDRRFRLHEQFAFQVFGVFQKREVCRSVSLQIKKSAFAQHGAILRTLRPADFIKASREEIDGVPFSHGGVKVLRQHLRAVRAKIAGTDENRLALRSKVWSTIVVYGPPSLWLTINPSDQDPIAQVLAGAEIDLDNFISTAGPEPDQRAKNIASDPFASAKFFHFIINMVLEVVLGVKKTRLGLIRRPGAFGTIQSYIGTVEAQGRGTLHTHMLLWLKDGPPASIMQAALQNEVFRDRVMTYIGHTIHADIDGRDTAGILQMPKRPAVSYCRPIDPVLSEAESSEEEKTLARTVQYHRCNLATCLRKINGRLECKRKAPFAIAPCDWVNAEGEWGPKRTCPNMNSWNPWLMRTVRANHDAKLIMNGAETCALLLYITNYAFKKQSRSNNTSALLADRLAYHTSQETDTEDIQLFNKRLLQRCANALFTQREFSGPEVHAYLMGWGDRFEANKYVPIYLDGAIRALKQAYPGLDKRPVDSFVDVGREPIIAGHATEDATGTLTIDDHNVRLKDQLHDYQFRGEELATANFYDFLVDTYEESHKQTDKEIDTSSKSTTGRAKNPRVCYLPAAQKSHKCRVLRTPGHEHLPRFIGKWFARNNDPNGDNDLHHATILLLLKPWRALHDLKAPNESFEQAYDRLLSTATENQLKMIENIQYYHDCWDAAQRRRDAFREGQPFRLFDYEREQIDDMDGDQSITDEEMDESSSNNAYVAVQQVSEETIEAARQEQRKDCDRRFAIQAMQLAHAAGVFGSEQAITSQPSAGTLFSRRATLDDIKIFNTWQKTLQDMTRKQAEEEGETNVDRFHLYCNLQVAEPNLQLEEAASISRQDNPLADNNKNAASINHIANINLRPKMQLLNHKQRKAHDKVEQCIFGNTAHQEQLLMLVIGQGGTGKSVLIEAISETFAFHQKSVMLAKTATSGVASSHIGGCTIHSWAGLGVQRLKTLLGSKAVTARRKRNILQKKCLIIDEMSMLYDTLLTDIAKVVAHTKKTAIEGNEHLPFAGMNVVLMGDFHQFPPVGKPYSALYSRHHTNDVDALQGRALYRQFQTVICLDEQIRVKDEGWIAILDRVRVGQCTDDDIRIIRTLILGSPDCPKTDFTCPPWSEAVLVTTRHAVREAWNAARLKQHCRNTGNRRYIVPSEDTVYSTGASLPNDMRLCVARMNEKKTKKLADRIEIAIGMKAMILFNLSTEADIANGTRGRITDIVLDPREKLLEANEDGSVSLQFPPALIMFEPEHGADISSAFTDKRAIHAIKVQKGQIPLTPSTVNFTLNMPDGTKVSITRRQYALTGGYAFTDFKSQGQTIENLIADLRDMPTGKISSFGVYVTLSRSRGRDTIRLLSDFDASVFKCHPSADLEAEMQRLNLLAATS